MAIATSSNSTAWSADVTVTTDTPFQAQSGGPVRITTDTGAAVGDGLVLQPWQTIVIPAGATFRWAPLSNIDCTVFFEEFGV